MVDPLDQVAVTQIGINRRVNLPKKLAKRTVHMLNQETEDFKSLKKDLSELKEIMLAQYKRGIYEQGEYESDENYAFIDTDCAFETPETCSTPDREATGHPTPRAASTSDHASTSTESEPPTKQARFEFNSILDVLAKKVKNTEPCGPPVFEKFVEIVETAARSRLSADARTELLKDKIKPKNCPLLTVSRLNSELWDLVSVETRYRDSRLQKIEELLVAGTVSIVKLADKMMTSIAQQKQRTISACHGG